MKKDNNHQLFLSNPTKKKSLNIFQKGISVNKLAGYVF